MIRLKKLYSIPKIFDPIVFKAGVNIILGEKSDKSNKTIGVGKSMCIEFVNFCLLKKSSESRLSLIPDGTVDNDAVISLDFTIGNDDITVSRSIKEPDTIKIFKNGNELFFDKIDDASDYLGDLYFNNFTVHTSRISFRNLLSPVLRDERSEFKDILQCHDTAKRIPNDYMPHLFFLNLSIDLYSDIKDIINELTKKVAYVGKIKKQLTKEYGTYKEAKSKLNELDSEVSKINAAVEQLRNNESFDCIQNELNDLEARLSKLRTKQKALRFEIKQINSLPEPENISEKEITMLFNQFKNGLGDMIEKSLIEAKEFKNKIYSFRKTIVNDKLNNLHKKLIAINDKIQKLDDDYSAKIALLDKGDLLRSLKISINIFRDKNSELSTLKTMISNYETAEKEKKSLENKKSNKVIEFDDLLNSNENRIKDFEETILNIHENIMGNRNAYFQIKTFNKTRNKEFLTFDFRTNDDGSWSTNRLKIFIYDLALMFNQHTKKYHPGFLIHDNIFNVDNDSLEKSLNYLYKQQTNHPEEFQYILTLNRDMLESIEERGLLNFNITDYQRAVFTKSNRFLKRKYNELKKKKNH